MDDESIGAKYIDVRRGGALQAEKERLGAIATLRGFTFANGGRDGIVIVGERELVNIFAAEYRAGFYDEPLHIAGDDDDDCI